MTNAAGKEKTHKTAPHTLTEYRLTLLEKNYDRLENKVDILSDKMDARFDFMLDKMDKEAKRVDARFEQVFKEIGNVHTVMHKEIGNVRIEIRDMLWKIPSICAVFITALGGIAKFFHWI